MIAKPSIVTLVKEAFRRAEKHPSDAAGPRSLKDVLNDSQFAVATLIDCNPDFDPVAYLGMLAGLKDDPVHRAMLQRMRDRVAERGFDEAYGAYDDLLPG